MGKIRYNSLGIVYHVLKKSPEHRVTFFTADHPSPYSILETVAQGSTQAHLFCELTPEFVKTVASDKKQNSMSDMTLDATRRLYPALDEELAYSVNQWIEYMLPVFYPGYIAEMNKFVSAQAEEKRSIYYCGDYLSQALVGGACSSGKHTADTIIRHYGGIS